MRGKNSVSMVRRWLLTEVDEDWSEVEDGQEAEDPAGVDLDVGDKHEEVDDASEKLVANHAYSTDYEDDDYEEGRRPSDVVAMDVDGLREMLDDVREDIRKRELDKGFAKWDDENLARWEDLEDLLVKLIDHKKKTTT